MYACACAIWAKPIDDVRALYAEGRYREAAEACAAILKKTPRDGSANYYLGASRYALGEYDAAVAPLLAAESRGVADASRMLAAIDMNHYRFEDADEHIDMWEKQLQKSKKAVPQELTEMRSRVILAKNMLDRVEKIEVIDSITVDSASFFKFYKLSAAAGRLLDSSALPPQYSRQNPTMAYRPESGTEIIWAMPDGDGVKKLVSAGILDDGTMQQPAPLGDDLGEGGDADFPFLMPDGVTLYFANNGENSIGGYDIFLSRRSSDGSALQPQNIGMPYNSPYDDYMLAIDEATGLGWWATDRNHIPGKVTIYTFIPNQTRVNYQPDEDGIADRARLTSIADTHVPGKDYASLLAALETLGTADGGTDRQEPDFALSMGNGRVYTSLSQFSDPQARQAMQQVLEARAELEGMRARLAALRRTYAAGDTSVADQIISLEKRVLAAGPILRRLTNTAIRLEND